MDNNHKAFFALIKAGLWENLNEFQISQDSQARMSDEKSSAGFKFQDSVDWDEIYRLAEEQSVIGVVLAGIEHTNVKLPQELLLQWIGEVQVLEQQNMSMNQFIAELVERLRKSDIYTLLVKGQGIAQCYKRPLWRACGDIDLFLNSFNYEKAKKILLPKANLVETENEYKKHVGMTINHWVVELHGTLRCGLSSNIDRSIDEIQNVVFYNGDVRLWMNGNTQVHLPGPNCDIIYVFIHLLNHFYKGGVGLRQFCDWCRLLWTYRARIDMALLERRLLKMGLVSEWKAFGSFLVNYLRMPVEAMPFYSADVKWKKKASRICVFILEVGDMGHNRGMGYYEKYPFLIRKVCSLGVRCIDMLRHARIFPLDSLSFFPRIMLNGIRSVVKGE